MIADMILAVAIINTRMQPGKMLLGIGQNQCTVIRSTDGTAEFVEFSFTQL